MGVRGSGRKARPTALRLLEGRRPALVNEAKPAILNVPPPDDLYGDALAEWNRVGPELYELGLLSKIDREALESYCQAVAQKKSAARAIKHEWELDKKRKKSLRTYSEGTLIRTQYGNLIQNPAVGIYNKASHRALRFMTEFGMTPASRSRIDVKKARTDDPTDEFLS